MDHPKDQALCLADWTSRVVKGKLSIIGKLIVDIYVCNIVIYLH